jgi:hypothetical protein
MVNVLYIFHHSYFPFLYPATIERTCINKPSLGIYCSLMMDQHRPKRVWTKTMFINGFVILLPHGCQNTNSSLSSHLLKVHVQFHSLVYICLQMWNVFDGPVQGMPEYAAHDMGTSASTTWWCAGIRMWHTHLQRQSPLAVPVTPAVLTAATTLPVSGWHNCSCGSLIGQILQMCDTTASWIHIYKHFNILCMAKLMLH